MRYAEFLVEYNRNVTLKQVNINSLLKAFMHDASMNFPNELDDLQHQVAGHFHPTYSDLSQEHLMSAASQVLGVIESLDPTPTKKFVPWLARMYANGSVRFEDINRNDLLTRYEEAKRKNLVPAEYKDITRIKAYDLFEEMMYELVLPNMEDTQEDPKNIQAKKVFEDDEVLVVVPENEAAACKYGRGTRWCTAATQGKNYFDDYSSSGNLYILIPKNPEHEGEKYQLHFQSKSFMDEQDDPVRLIKLLTERFPSLDKFFKEYTKPEVREDKWSVKYYEYGLLHREDGPAVVGPDGTFERWFKHGGLHREDGPASIDYDDNGNIQEVSWWINGERHRIDGPAWKNKSWNSNAKNLPLWWLFGKNYPSEEDYVEALEKFRDEGKI